MEDTTDDKPYVVLGLGHGETPEEFLILVDESERGGIPFQWLTRDLSALVERHRQSGKKDYDIARAIGFLAGGDCKFGFYLGKADVDTYFYLQLGVCYSFLQEYGPGSTKEYLVKDKKVRFLVCSSINVDEIRAGKDPVYVISDKNADGQPRPFEVLDYRTDLFYEQYQVTQRAIAK
jgi:hypothetical protein